MSQNGAEETEQSPREDMQETAAEPDQVANDGQQIAVERDEARDKEQSKGSEVAGEGEKSSRKMARNNRLKTRPEDREAQRRQRQFVAEFNRLKESLEKEATKIVKPDFQPYTPYIHTSLAPYHNTYTVQFLLNLPPHIRHGYVTRKTAIGLVDPEVSHRMDIIVDEVPQSVPVSVASISSNLSPRSQGLKGAKEGSTRLPKWPVVKFQKTEDVNKKLNWGDVPRLRETLRTQYSSNAQERIKNDYDRTVQDWSRMELERLQDVHEVNRGHMKITCSTYLGTSPGSRKAVKSLTKVLE